MHSSIECEKWPCRNHGGKAKNMRVTSSEGEIEEMDKMGFVYISKWKVFRSVDIFVYFMFQLPIFTPLLFARRSCYISCSMVRSHPPETDWRIQIKRVNEVCTEWLLRPIITILYRGNYGIRVYGSQHQRGNGKRIDILRVFFIEKLVGFLGVHQTHMRPNRNSINAIGQFKMCLKCLVMC